MSAISATRTRPVPVKLYPYPHRRRVREYLYFTRALQLPDNLMIACSMFRATTLQDGPYINCVNERCCLKTKIDSAVGAVYLFRRGTVKRCRGDVVWR